MTGRQDAVPPPEVVRAIDRLAELPLSVSERLADGVDAIYVGPGGVPDLDDMGRLHGVPLPVRPRDVGCLRGCLRRAQDHHWHAAFRHAGRGVPRDRARPR